MECMCNVGEDGTLFDGYADTKLFKVNFTSLSKCGTVEFRQHDGTTEYDEVDNWIKLVLQFCSVAISENSPTAFELANLPDKLSTLFTRVLNREILLHYVRAIGIDEASYEEDLRLLFLTLPVFLYGTLMSKRLLAWLLTGDQNETEVVKHEYHASLSVYLRRTVAGQDYPSIIPACDADQVRGLIFVPRSIADRRKLQNFEGETYKIDKVTVFSRAGGEHEALAYVWNGDPAALGNEDWSLDDFESGRLNDWLELFDGVEFL
jgi:gamma-glutamylcyclotransferase (GGCT)/AIG2-like uncharacterized protein YtfP